MWWGGWKSTRVDHNRMDMMMLSICACSLQIWIVGGGTALPIRDMMLGRISWLCRTS
jgi:hypothetical protein